MSKGLILFVHGLGGSGEGTWGNFLKLARNDPKLSNYDIAYYEYPMTLKKMI